MIELSVFEGGSILLQMTVLAKYSAFDDVTGKYCLPCSSLAASVRTYSNRITVAPDES